MVDILLIEDDDDIRNSLAEVLEFEGFSVVGAVHGQDALDQIEAGLNPRMIVTDLLMPIMNGEEFLQIRERREDLLRIPAIICSASYHRSPVKDVPFIRKPINIKCLCDTIRTVIGG